MTAFLTDPLLLIIAASALTWLLCRWWYRRRLGRLKRELALALARADAPFDDTRREPFIDTTPAVAPAERAEPGDATETARRPVPELSDDYPSVPFLDTSPSTHEPSTAPKHRPR